jgi:hypothetical protein
MRPELHPACAAFPPLPTLELQALADDIKENGLLLPITLVPDGRILDGRCRWDACEIAGVEPRTEVYTGDDPYRFVISRNERRRHLPLVERAWIAEELANLAHGSNQHQRVDRVKTRPTLTRPEAAAAMDISEATVGQVRLLKKQASPHIIDMVKRGDLGIDSAARAVSGTSQQEQETWRTPADVLVIYRRKVEVGKGKKPVALKGKVKAKPFREVIDIPYKPIQFPTAEETGFPVDGDMHEQDAHRLKYGRTPLHPKAVKDMITTESVVENFINAIVLAANERHPDASAFFGAIDDLLAWKPDKERGKGYEINFAAKARRHLILLERYLEPLISRLTELQRLHAARRAA